MENTYEDTLLGSGYIAGWPGMHPAGSRIMRNEWGDVVDVLPPVTQEKALPLISSEVVAEEAPATTIAQPESEASA